ncbi:unnamed protein product [Closterium sp. NIES-54]
MVEGNLKATITRAREIGRRELLGRELYFLLVVDDYTHYSMAFPLRSKGEVPGVLITWVHAVRLQLRERFRQDLPVLRLHSDIGGEFSSNLLRDFCRGEGILQSFTLPASPQQNGIAERRIGLVMGVAHTSMIHAAAPHFLWPFAGPAPSGVSQIDPLPLAEHVKVTVDSCAFRGAASGGAEPASAEPESGGAEPESAEPGGTEPEAAESGGAEPRGTASAGGPAGASPRVSHRRETLSPQQLHEWFAQRTRVRSGAAGAGGSAAGGTGAGGAAATSPGGAGVTTGATGPGSARTRGTGAARTRGTRAARTSGVGGARAGDPGVRGAGAGRAGDGAGAGVPLPAPSPYTKETGGPTERREPESCPASPVRAVGTGRRSPPTSSLPDLPNAESDLARVASPTFPRLLATVVIDPLFESAPASALVAELVDFSAACRLDYDTSLVAESESDSPPSVGDTHGHRDGILEVHRHLRQRGSSFWGEHSRWHVDFKGEAAAGFSDCLQGSLRCTMLHLHEEIWLRRPPGFTESFPASTQWSIQRPVYGLRKAPRKWHDTLRTALVAFGFAPSTADPSMFLRTDTLLSPFFVLVYVNELVFATANTKALALVKSELQKRHTCTDLGELRNYLGLQLTRDRAQRTITLTQSHMVHQVVQRFGFRYSSPQSTPLPTSHSLSAPPSDESVELSGSYPELVGTENETRSTGGQVGLYHPPFEKSGLPGSSLQEGASGKTS